MQPNGSIRQEVKLLGRQQQEELHYKMDQDVREYVQGKSLILSVDVGTEGCMDVGMSEERRLKFLALQEGRVLDCLDNDNDGDFEDIPMTAEDILHSRVELEISHAGREF